MRIVKQRLLEMLPDARVFLDVDDLKEGKGAEYVDASAMSLIFCSQGYFSSPNCMRELLRAAVTRKPILTLLEPEAKHGGLTLDEIRAPREYRALVEVALVGDLVRVQIRRLGEADHGRFSLS